MTDESSNPGTPNGASDQLRANDATTDATVMDDAREQLAEARRRLADAPVATVLTNHVMGIYELAAIHLSSQPPDLASASLAIDAVAALVEGLGDRLDEIETLRDALGNIRMAFVQIAGSSTTPPAATGPDQPAAASPEGATSTWPRPADAPGTPGESADRGVDDAS